MMTNNFSASWLPFGWHLHVLFLVAILLGLILFLRWAFLALDKKSLMGWILWFLVIGLLGMFLTSGWGFQGMQAMHGSGQYGSDGFWSHMLQEDHEDIETAEQWREHMLEEMEEHMGF